MLQAFNFGELLAAEAGQSFARALIERLSFDKLMSLSDPKRIARSATVRVPPLKFDAYKDQEAYYFNVKSSPSTTGLRHKGYVKVFKPKDPNTPLEKVDCEVDCQCFAPDTKVLMSTGVYKPISEIVPGDWVYTHRGRIRQVMGNVGRPLQLNEKVYSIKIEGFPEAITATEGHPFYVLRGNSICRCGCGQMLPIWHGRESVNPGMILNHRFIRGHFQEHTRVPNKFIENILSDYASVSPRRHTGRKPNEHSCRSLAERYGVSRNTVQAIISGRLRQYSRLPDERLFQFVKVKDLQRHEWFLMPWMEAGGTSSIDPDIARFIGYYASDGHLSVRRSGKSSDMAKFTLHETEKLTLAEDIGKIASNKGVPWFRLPHPTRGQCRDTDSFYHIRKGTSSICKRQQKTIIATCFISPEFRKFLQDNVGVGSRKKCFSPLLMAMDNETLKNILTGLFLGDGHVLATGRFRWTSVSPSLVWNVSTALNRLRVRHQITPCGQSMAVDVTLGSEAKTLLGWLQPYLRPEALARIAASDGLGNKPDYRVEEGQLKVMSNRSQVDYAGVVYDLCVDEDHSFIVGNVAVANCPDYKYRWAWANKQRGSSKVGPSSLNQAWNQAPRITNPNGRPGLCKHVIATRDYIYGQVRSFGSDQDYDSTTSKLDRLVKQSQKRWSDYPAEVAKARERDAAIQQSIKRATELRAKNPSLLAQTQPSVRADAGSPAVTKSADKVGGARASGPTPELAKTGSAKAAQAAQKAGDDSIAAWRARRSEESMEMATLHVSNEMTNLVDQVTVMVEELEKASAASNAIGRPGTPPNEEESEDLRLLREIRDIVRHLAGDDLPAEFAEGGEDEPLSEPGIPVDAVRSRDQN